MEPGRFVLWVLTLVVASVIFVLSSQPAAQSDKVSYTVTEAIVNAMPGSQEISCEEKHDIVRQLDSKIRKFAHFFLYFMLGIFLTGAILYKTYIIDKKTVGLAIAICFVYAVSDEIHQFFVDGRSFQIKDIFIDTCGSIFGGAIVILGKRYFNRTRRDYR
ncbi:MAG: VanZ family protein [Firmicutes bacterium]|nr:VanZ family protein [Bacillota bacterium]